MHSRYIDISTSLRADLPVWPSDRQVSLEPAFRTAAGDGANITNISIGTHTGTHVDAEWHFMDDGRTLEALTADRLLGPCFVADLSGITSHVTVDDLESANIPDDTTRLLLKTPNSNLWETSPDAFVETYFGITSDGAEWIVNRGIDLIGIDYHSVEPFTSPGVTHRIILGAGRIILETVDLRDVSPGHYHLYCLPLRIDGYDGAPCRAVLGVDE